MSYKLFLDDIREPTHCLQYMHLRRGKTGLYAEEWTVVRNYDEFVSTVKEKGVPEVVSFDHDLADEHYVPSDSQTSFDSIEDYMNRTEGDYKEKTGYDCAKWLYFYCEENGEQFPKYMVHSMNTVGTERIHKFLSKTSCML